MLVDFSIEGEIVFRIKFNSLVVIMGGKGKSCPFWLGIELLHLVGLRGTWIVCQLCIGWGLVGRGVGEGF